MRHTCLALVKHLSGVLTVCIVDVLPYISYHVCIFISTTYIQPRGHWQWDSLVKHLSCVLSVQSRSNETQPSVSWHCSKFPLRSFKRTHLRPGRLGWAGHRPVESLLCNVLSSFLEWLMCMGTSLSNVINVQMHLSELEML